MKKNEKDKGNLVIHQKEYKLESNELPVLPMKINTMRAVVIIR